LSECLTGAFSAVKSRQCRSRPRSWDESAFVATDVTNMITCHMDQRIDMLVRPCRHRQEQRYVAITPQPSGGRGDYVISYFVHRSTNASFDVCGVKTPESLCTSAFHCVRPRVDPGPYSCSSCRVRSSLGTRGATILCTRTAGRGTCCRWFAPRASPLSL